MLHQCEDPGAASHSTHADGAQQDQRITALSSHQGLRTALPQLAECRTGHGYAHQYTSPRTTAMPSEFVTVLDGGQVHG